MRCGPRPWPGRGVRRTRPRSFYSIFRDAADSDLVNSTATHSPPNLDQIVDQLHDAIGRHDLDAADRLVAGFKQPYPVKLLEPIGALHVVRQRWAQAAEVYGRIRFPAKNIEALRRYAANLAALQECHPHAYKVVIEAPEAGQYEIDDERVGLPTIVRIHPDGRCSPVIAGASPQEQMAATFKVMEQAKKPTTGLGLAGIGDGHILANILKRFPPDHLGIELPLVVIEPDPDLVRAVFLLHDLSGEDGPIRSKRVEWFIGPRWASQFEAVCLKDLCMIPPTVVAQLSPHSAAICQTLSDVYNSVIGEPSQRIYEEATRDYLTRTPEQWAQIIRGQAGRPPRVLFVTSRFTTVLQYSTRDTADAFERLGWQTHVMIEPAPYRRLTGAQFSQAMRDFRPDLVFMIDYLRNGLPTALPSHVPFVCWVQDDLHHLMQPSAGRSVGPRDFILAPAPVLYVQAFEYPLRQCIYVDKLTRLPSRPSTWTSDGDDLVFVSNASKTSQQVVDEMLGDAKPGDLTQQLLRECCGRMIAAYDRGQTLYSPNEVEKIVIVAGQSLSIRGIDKANCTKITLRLFNSLNNALYRQQAVRWAAEVAEELGLSLALYGKGWDSNPDFAPFARGPVKYGPELEELTRRSKINLQIVPFSCLHQRLLDGLVAGGFFLIRHHPMDQLHQLTSRFMRTLPEDVRNLAAARAGLSRRGRDELESMLKLGKSTQLDATDDPVAVYRRHQQGGSGFLYEPLPRWSDVTFNDRDTLRSQVLRYLNNPGLCRQVMDEQRRFVESTRTYEVGLKRVVERIAVLLEEESSISDPAGLAQPPTSQATLEAHSS